MPGPDCAYLRLHGLARGSAGSGRLPGAVSILPAPSAAPSSAHDPWRAESNRAQALSLLAEHGAFDGLTRAPRLSVWHEPPLRGDWHSVHPVIGLWTAQGYPVPMNRQSRLLVAQLSASFNAVPCCAPPNAFIARLGSVSLSQSP
jgi:hypothetical protein